MTQDQLQTTMVDLGLIIYVILEDQEPTSLDPHNELLHWRYSLGHLSFEHILQLAQTGQLPKHLLTCEKPFCTSCQYGKMTKHLWRVKGDDKMATKTDTWPRQIVSMDQLESNTPGFIAQLKGKLTQQQYNYDTVFVDQFSGYTFIYLQYRIMSKETVKAKHAFESPAEQCSVKILHYHADNGRFTDNALIADYNAQQQSLSYCGINAHFQNGITKRCIRDLQEETRTSMLYAMNKWKRMNFICLWPYAMRHANDVANAMPRKVEDISPLEKFLGIPVRPKLHHFHTFGCPSYVLDNAIQSRQGVPKWKQCARLGIYLGPSPSHTRMVALVLNPCTGQLPPQFHVKFDDFFESIGDTPTGMDTLEPELKYLSGFGVKKGATKVGTMGALANLLALRRGPARATSVPSLPDMPDESQTDQQQGEPALDFNHNPIGDAAQQPPTDPVSLAGQQGPQPQVGQPVHVARQTRSSRVVRNTPWYDNLMLCKI